MNPTPPPHLAKNEPHLVPLWYDAIGKLYRACGLRPPVEARHLGLVYVEAKARSDR